MNLHPLGDRIALKVDEEVTQSDGGILLTTGEVPPTGKAIAVGPGRILETGERIEMTVAVGDMVVFPKGGGETVTVDGEEIFIIHEAQIIGILK